MKYYITIILSLCFVNCSAQKLNSRDSTYRKHADSVLKTYFGDNLMHDNLLLLSMGVETYLVIVEKQNVFQQYHVDISAGKSKSKILTSIIKKPNDTLKKAFDTKIYREGFTNLGSDLYKSGYDGLLTAHNSSYFVLLDKNGKRYGEYCLPIIVKPNPIDSSVYRYLSYTLFQQINNSGKKSKNYKKRK